MFILIRRPRLSIAGLMIVVAVAALVAFWLRPMTGREAVREAIAAVHGAGPLTLVGDPMAPPSWRVGEVSRDARGYVVRLETEGESSDGYFYRATIWIDAKTRRPHRMRHDREHPIGRARRLDRTGPIQTPTGH
ncbi:hypothetical protein AB1L88_02955 [Tautonia sp. JC769]|uniref:hypothetical protein n=1 Tax=Tautonia sp. JC769 TaxID=3232135 RepID=UPI003457427C